MDSLPQDSADFKQKRRQTDQEQTPDQDQTTELTDVARLAQSNKRLAAKIFRDAFHFTTDDKALPALAVAGLQCLYEQGQTDQANAIMVLMDDQKQQIEAARREVARLKEDIADALALADVVDGGVPEHAARLIAETVNTRLQAAIDNSDTHQSE